jgi:hypothetical protein
MGEAYLKGELKVQTKKDEEKDLDFHRLMMLPKILYESFFSF